MATWKQVILKDPITGEYLAPMGGNFSGGDADTLQSHPASDFLLKSEYTPVDLSEYLKTATADTKYAAASHTHTTGQISDLSTVLAGYAPASHTHTTANITGLDTKLSGYDSEIANLKTSVSNGKSAVASAITDKGVSTSATASFNTMAANIGKIEIQSMLTLDIRKDYGTNPDIRAQYNSADNTFTWVIDAAYRNLDIVSAFIYVLNGHDKSNQSSRWAHIYFYLFPKSKTSYAGNTSELLCFSGQYLSEASGEKGSYTYSKSTGTLVMTAQPFMRNRNDPDDNIILDGYIVFG